jgi:Amt family ammonium transporter
MAQTRRPVEIPVSQMKPVCHFLTIYYHEEIVANFKLITTATTNLNQWYQAGDQAFIIVASCMVLLMIPGLGFLYSGLARRKSALSTIWACMASFSIIVFQWFFWGYSLAFSNTGTSGFIGDLQHFGLMNTLATPSPGSPLIPELLYSFYQVCLHE